MKIKLILPFIALLGLLQGLGAAEQAKKPVVHKDGMSAKWHELNRLISEEMNTIKTITNRGPRLRWRMIELKTETIKLVREKENKNFLEANPALIRKRGKKSFFRKSQALYREVRRDGLNLIKKFPRFRYLSEVYYTLALNSRDYGGDKETEKFLLRSLKYSIPNSPIVHAAKTSLAEHYYNGKKYKKAIRFYRDVLKNQTDEWTTKHLYNLSWCYIKTKDYNQAIEHAKDSFFKSEKKEYINVQNEVLGSIGFFFVLAERVEEGARFYVDNVEHPTEYMIKMAKKTAEDRGYEKAKFVFDAALENAISKKYRKEEIEIRLSQLDFYRNFKRFENFWKTTVALDAIHKLKPLEEDYQTEATDKIRSFVGYLQIRFTRNSKTNITNYSEEEKVRIIKFFDVLARINPKKTDHYRYMQGETHFAISDFNNSFLYYQKTLEFNKKAKEHDEKLRLKTFDALLASLENGQFKKKVRTAHTIYTFTNHINIYPRNERSRKIYSKLFNIYLEEKKLPLALKTLERYTSVYKEDLKIQQGMFTQILDTHIKNKNTDQIAAWIPKLKAGYLKFDNKYFEKTTLILGGLLFDGYQKMDASGKKDEAAKGYLALFGSEKYPQSIKAKSAYRASFLFLDLNKTNEAQKWMNTALKLFTPKERFQRKKEILTFVNSLMLNQDFVASAQVAHTYLSIYCTSRFKEKNDLYRVSVQYQLVAGEPTTALKNYKMGKRCKVPQKVTDEVLQGIGSFFVRHRQNKNFLTFYKAFKKESKLRGFFERSFLSFYWSYYRDQNENGERQVKTFLKGLIKSAQYESEPIKEMKAIFAFDQTLKKTQAFKWAPFPSEESFNEEAFNGALEKNIEALKGLTQTYTPFIKMGYPHLVTRSYKVLEHKYKQVGEFLLGYTPKAKGLPKEYVDGFKGAMRNLAMNFINEARGQKTLAYRLISRELILDPEVPNLLDIKPIITKIGHRHPASLYVLPKDRKGGKL